MDIVVIVVCQAAHLSTLRHFCTIPTNFAPPSLYKMVSFPALNKADGLKAVDEHLLTRSYITG